MAIQITRMAGSKAPDALAPQAELFSGLRAFRQVDAGTSGQRRNFDFPAQRGQRERYREVAMQVFVLAPENLVRLEPDFNIQIPRRPAIDAGLAVAGRTDSHSVVDTGRNGHLQRLVATDAANAVTGTAWILDFLTRAMASRAGLLNTEKALLHAHHDLPATHVAGDRAGAGLGTGAGTRFAGVPAGHTNFRVETVGRLFKRDVQRVAEIAAAIDLRTALTAAEDIAETIAEDIREPGLAHARPAGTGRIRIYPGMAKAVVRGPLFIVRQDFIGLFGFFELIFRVGTIRVAVRVVFHGKPTIRLAQLVFAGVS